MASPKLELRVHPDLLARIDLAASEAGLSRSTWVTVALASQLARLDDGERPMVLASVRLPVKGAPTVSIPQPKAHRASWGPTEQESLDAIVRGGGPVEPASRPSRTPSPVTASARPDPRAGCTHPPASVRTRGGIRSCGNCGTVLAAKT